MIETVCEELAGTVKNGPSVGEYFSKSDSLLEKKSRVTTTHVLSRAPFATDWLGILKGAADGPTI